MNELKERMIHQALQKFERIYPCAKSGNFADCFTQIDDRLLFWFNTDDESTHLITRRFHQPSATAAAWQE